MATKSSSAAVLFDIILSTPGMTDHIKLQVTISRKNVLLLGLVIDLGLANRTNDESGLLNNVSGESLEELRNFSDQCLDRANLIELSKKIREL